MNGPLRIGIVGAGRIVRAEHLPRFRAIDGVEIVVVANRDRASSERAASELGIPRAIDDWRALVGDPGVDAVLVGAWPVLHAPVTIAALEAGKHVLTEARMAATADDARAMLRTAQAHPDLTAMVVPASFSLWADGTIARLLREGAIGRVRHARVHWDASAPGDPGDHWRWRREHSGQNVMALGILVEGMARWLGEPTAVTATTRIGADPRMGPDGPFAPDVPDHVLAIVDHPDDVTATIEMSARTNATEPDGAVIHGTDGSLRIDLAGRRLELIGRDGTRREVDIHAEDRAEWTAEIDFVAAIRGEAEVTLTDFATGVAYMAFLEAVERSNAEGRRVAIEP